MEMNLNFGYLTPRVWQTDGTMILVHDWFNTKDDGVQKSFKDWIKKTGFNAVHFHDYDWCGKAFVIKKC